MTLLKNPLAGLDSIPLEATLPAKSKPMLIILPAKPGPYENGCYCDDMF